MLFRSFAQGKDIRKNSLYKKKKKLTINDNNVTGKIATFVLEKRGLMTLQKRGLMIQQGFKKNRHIFKTF